MRKFTSDCNYVYDRPDSLFTSKLYEIVDDMIKYRDYLPKIIAYHEKFMLPECKKDSVPADIDPEKREKMFNVMSVTPENVMHYRKTLQAFGFDRACQLIDRYKAFFAGFHKRTGVRSPLNILAIGHSLFDKQVMRLPLQLATGFQSSKVAKKTEESADHPASPKSSR